MWVLAEILSSHFAIRIRYHQLPANLPAAKLSLSESCLSSGATVLRRSCEISSRFVFTAVPATSQLGDSAARSMLASLNVAMFSWILQIYLKRSALAQIIRDIGMKLT